MIVCVGPINAGKTLLLRRLQDDLSPSSFEDIACTVPTVGTNIFRIKLDKKTCVTIHELGGAMAPIWDKHYDECTSLIIVIDSSNLQQVSCSCIQLLEILTHKKLQNVKIFLALNKTDIKTTINIVDFKYILRLDDIIKSAQQQINVVETSCITRKGFDELKEWLLKNNQQN